MIENTQLKLQFYNFDKPTKFKLQNAHHTIKLNPLDGMSGENPFTNMMTAADLQSLNASLPDLITIDDPTLVKPPEKAGVSSKDPYDGKPTIKLDWFDDGNNEFRLHDIHLHWAERRDNGSEHSLDGRRAAMEVSFTVNLNPPFHHQKD